MNVLLALCVALAVARGSRYCPELMIDSCHCTAERSKQFSRQSVRVKAVCDDADLTETMQPSSIPNTTVSLILSNNKISALKNNSFLGLRALERLDLSSNLISRIAPGAFHGLTALRRLSTLENESCSRSKVHSAGKRLSASRRTDAGAMQTFNVTLIAGFERLIVDVRVPGCWMRII
ncbi:adhesion G protein-coupled receptor A2-like [Sinocyclocheilus rhinocerous]|uniref:adhesion G protein-coupled receptor A2-like n=1 Tax=Sinocyclocheilus rhinocerous TaxID=307959 RepID=UPI0007B9D202|nr:PREDICTED: adhesion G protein-coupled receptor A2-like [Sinocyclocheilus rhinocerous]